MLFVATSLAFAVVLSLAGVLGQVLLISCHHDTGECRRTGVRFGVAGDWLGVESGSGSAEKACEGRGKDEVVYIVAFHKEFLSSMRHWIYASGY
jgi:hypothetical protein